MSDANQRKPLARGAVRTLLVAFWCLMALALTVFGTLVCVVNVMSSKQLTDIAVYAANRTLTNARVSIGRVELTMRSTFPFLTLDVDSVLVLSEALHGLPAEQLAALPQYSDTLFALESFHGGVNVPALLLNRLELRDVTFKAPEINVVVAGEGYNNFNVYQSTADTASTRHVVLPEIAINRFRILDPRQLRFYDAVTDTWGALGLRMVNVEGVDAPLYTLDFRGDFMASGLRQIGIEGLPFSFEGGIRWNPKAPDFIELVDFRARLAILDLMINTRLDFGRDLIVDRADIALEPVSFTSMLALVPDSMLRVWGLTERVRTNAALGMNFHLDRPFNVSTQTMPYATATVDVSDSYVYYGDYGLDLLALSAKAALHGDDPTRSRIELNRLELAGPMTHISLTGNATELGHDPLLNGCLKADAKLESMPPRLRDLVQGFLSGQLDADIDFTMRPSMLSRNNFHKLKVKGDIDGDRLYWLSDDTMSLAYVSRLCLRFGTNEVLRSESGRRADSLLAANIMLDSANVLFHNYEFVASGLKLGVGASNHKRPADSLAIIPMGGGLKVDRFTFKLLTDSTTVRARDLQGRIGMQPHKGERTRPQLVFDLNVGRASAGNTDTRFMLSDAKIRLDAHKLPVDPKRKKMRRVIDSLTAAHPDLPSDSVYALAYQRYAHRRKGPHRVHPEMLPDSLEVIDWGTSSQLRNLLLDWELSGSVAANRGALFTPFFPVRNRVEHINVTLNNDTIQFNNLAFKAGHSDLLASGRISNLKRGMTSRGFRSPLKVNFDVLCDTIDINQISSAAFRGSAYAQDRRLRVRMADSLAHTADDDLQTMFDDMVREVPDTALKPLLVPVNVEGDITVKANNLIYADMLLKNLSGQVLVYDGALNLHRLKASSDFGSVDLSALYSAPSVNRMRFGFGLNVDRFYLDRFLRLVPAIDSIMPLLRNISGIIDGQVAATVNIDRHMNLDLPSLSAVVKLEGDSLRLLDAKTFNTLAKWLLFKDKKEDMIKHMSVEMLVSDNMMRIYPFVFDFDRYRLGVQGYNTLAMDLNYHIAVLKSPLPFKFGINLTGTPENLKVRLGGARFNEQSVVSYVGIADTTRVNLLQQIEKVFRRGVRNSEFAKLEISKVPEAAQIDLQSDTISHADSLVFIREGLIPAGRGQGIEASDGGSDRGLRAGKRSR